MIEEDEPIAGICEEEILNLRPLRQEREARILLTTKIRIRQYRPV